MSQEDSREFDWGIKASPITDFYTELDSRLLQMVRLNDVAQLSLAMQELDSKSINAKKQASIAKGTSQEEAERQAAVEQNKANKVVADIRKAVYKPMLVVGDPGIGKTEGIRSHIEKVNDEMLACGNPIRIGFKTIALGQTIVGDMSGIPVPIKVKDADGTERTVVTKVQTDELPDEKRDGKYGVLLLDEITTADVQQAQPAFSLLDANRGIGPYHLPDNWLVIGAGNGPKWANFISLPSAIVTRCQSFNVEADYSIWREYATKAGIDAMVLSFLDVDHQTSANEHQGDYFMAPPSEEWLDELKQGAEPAYPSPRGWKLVSDAINQSFRDYIYANIGKTSADASWVTGSERQKQLNKLLLEQIKNGTLNQYVAQAQANPHDQSISNLSSKLSKKDEYYEVLAKDPEKVEILASSVGSDAAMRFSTFLSLYDAVAKIITPEQILVHAYSGSPSDVMRELQSTTNSGMTGGGLQILNTTAQKIANELRTELVSNGMSNLTPEQLCGGITCGNISLSKNLVTRITNFCTFLCQQGNLEYFRSTLATLIGQNRQFSAMLAFPELTGSVWENTVLGTQADKNMTEAVSDAVADANNA